MFNFNYKKLSLSFSIGHWKRVTSFSLTIRDNENYIEVVKINNDVIPLFEVISFLEAFIANQIQHEGGVFWRYQVKQKEKIPYLSISNYENGFILETFISKTEARMYLKILKILERKLTVDDSIEKNFQA